MFYPYNIHDKLQASAFKNPPSEFRAAPFWAWNCKLDKKLLKEQLKFFKEMGFGGTHIHPRVGLATPYLSDEYMDFVNYCITTSKHLTMRTYLYDEDKWASGYAGGFNTSNIEYRQKTLLITRIPFNDGTLKCKKDISNSTQELPKGKYLFLAAYDVILDENGYMTSYKKIAQNCEANGIKLFAYCIYASDSAWYNNQAYVDTMCKEAIENFIKITHEKYKEKTGKYFGNLVPSIFTDEPQMTQKTYLKDPFEIKGVEMPYTTDLDKTFKSKYKYSLFSRLPELVYELPDGKISDFRYKFHDHTAERFASSYADTIGEWCETNGIALTGHLMREPSLWTQTGATGETMRSYRSFQIPGIDMLADHHELSTAKQCQSAVRQFGKEGMASELFGATDWFFDFKGHKQQGDWQAAMGVTTRVPHLSFLSMKGDAKRDYPASIGYQSSWYKQYKYLEDHFARISACMTRGKPIVNIGVIHPVESYWLKFGPQSQTGYERDELQRKFYEMINWLEFSSLDFDLVSESLLPSLYKGSDSDGFHSGEETYKVIIVPELITIRSTTLKYLNEFIRTGGKVVFMGEPPKYVDAFISKKGINTAEHSVSIGWNKKDLFNILDEFREISITKPDGSFSTNLIYNYRKEKQCRHLFISHVVESKDYDSETAETYNITIKGEWKLKQLDTLTGNIVPLKATYENGCTKFSWTCYICDSLLLELVKGKSIDGFIFRDYSFNNETYLSSECEYTLSEKNVALLDKPKYSVNDGDLSDETFILDVDDAVRKEFELRNTSSPQPWVKPADTTKVCSVKLVFEFESSDEFPCSLGLENLQFTKEIKLNGISAASLEPTGYYIDMDAIKTINLPNIIKGKNTLEIVTDYCEAAKLEAYYLLGDFGVKLNGNTFSIEKLPEKLYFGDLTKQGLPFYGANVTYHQKINENGFKYLQVKRFYGTCISCAVDGEELPGLLVFPPNVISLGNIEKGEHNLDITIYGNRHNTLGHLHNVILKPSFPSPNYWHPEKRFYTPEYMIRPFGIFTTPNLIDN